MSDFGDNDNDMGMYVVPGLSANLRVFNAIRHTC
jgi:hypothetical protein